MRQGYVKRFGLRRFEMVKCDFEIRNVPTETGQKGCARTFKTNYGFELQIYANKLTSI
jgi:hypothetical protein